MTKEKELKDEELEKVNGGATNGVTDVVKGVIYKHKTRNDYAYVTNFPGIPSAHVNFKKGVLQPDGKIRKLYYQVYQLKYTTFKNDYDLINTLSSDYWDDTPIYS